MPASRPPSIGVGAMLLAAALIGALARPFEAPVRASSAPVTFSRDVAPILQANCQECHRPGGIGPFSLLTYTDARDRAALIRHYTAQRIMPPWKAAAGYGEFLDERRLSAVQIETIARWVEDGAAEGDPKDLPPPRPFVDGWMLGKPDLVLDAGQDYSVKAQGSDVYRNFVLPYRSDEDQWVTAVEVSPGRAEIVHHVVLFIDPDGVSETLDRASPGPGFTVNGADAGFSPAIVMDLWAPGATPRFLPAGTAWKIPAGARLVMQVHYHPNGQAQQDRTRLGLHFARGPIDKRVRTGAIAEFEFVIPPGEARHEVTAWGQLPLDITVLSLWPHMHMLGKEMKVTATTPEGTAKPLVWIPDWDFHWQQIFSLKEPMRLPQGSWIELTAYYDNSAENPHNPSRPPKTVRFGPQTTDEMCFCFFRYTVDEEHLTEGVAVEDDGIETRG